jgi:hypothetical protein
MKTFKIRDDLAFTGSGVAAVVLGKEVGVAKIETAASRVNDNNPNDSPAL